MTKIIKSVSSYSKSVSHGMVVGDEEEQSWCFSFTKTIINKRPCTSLQRERRRTDKLIWVDVLWHAPRPSFPPPNTSDPSPHVLDGSKCSPSSRPFSRNDTHLGLKDLQSNLLRTESFCLPWKLLKEKERLHPPLGAIDSGVVQLVVVGVYSVLALYSGGSYFRTKQKFQHLNA